MHLHTRLSEHARWKKLAHYLLIPKGLARPRRWVSWFVNPFVHKRGARTRIGRSVRLDVLPFRQFALGAGSSIEDFSVVNNGVGDVLIGTQTRVGIGNVLIGPLRIGNQVNTAQHVVMSGLNHGYEDIHTPIDDQPVSKRLIVIDDECWIGANVVVTAGVHIGRHAVVAAGSVVTKNVPPYSVVAGNPARVIKQYSHRLQRWERVRPVSPVPARLVE